MQNNNSFMVFGPFDPTALGCERDGVEVFTAAATWNEVARDAIRDGSIDKPGIYFIQADDSTAAGAFVRVEQPPVTLTVVA